MERDAVEEGGTGLAKGGNAMILARGEKAGETRKCDDDGYARYIRAW